MYFSNLMYICTMELEIKGLNSHRDSILLQFVKDDELVVDSYTQACCNSLVLIHSSKYIGLCQQKYMGSPILGFNFFGYIANKLGILFHPEDNYMEGIAEIMGFHDAKGSFLDNLKINTTKGKVSNIYDLGHYFPIRQISKIIRKHAHLVYTDKHICNVIPAITKEITLKNYETTIGRDDLLLKTTGKKTFEFNETVIRQKIGST